MEVASLYREPEAEAEQLHFGALEFHDVFRIYHSGPARTVALRGLDLRVEPRELVALFGPSGSGKSTALQLAAGLDEPSAGEVRALGRSLGRHAVMLSRIILRRSEVALSWAEVPVALGLMLFYFLVLYVGKALSLLFPGYMQRHFQI